MTDDEIIADQRRKIVDLEERIKASRVHADKIASIAFSIGGPLNDNKLRYNSEQLAEIGRMVQNAASIKDYLDRRQS